MELYEQGKEYWTVLKRFHANRNNPTMKRVALQEMQAIRAGSHSEAVQRRTNSFIAKHGRKPLGWPPSGPRIA